jgi:alpha-glucosidase
MFDQSPAFNLLDHNTQHWQGMVIYQIYPRSFKDSNNDGIGDLAGISSELKYIANLGVDGIWISPFFKSPMVDFGYDIADFCDVAPQFGTLDDFDTLIRKAHKLGLKVIIDQVYSHTSDQHQWFIESRKNKTNPKADWYVWAEAKPDGSPPNNWQSVFMGPAWSWDTARSQYYLHNFLREQPDLNIHNQEVQDAILETAKFWLERGVDGFRMDAVNFYTHNQALTDNPELPFKTGAKPFDMQSHINNQSQPETPLFLERFRALMDEYPGTFTMAEIGGENALLEMKEYTRESRRLNTAYSFDFIEAPELTAKLIRDTLESWAKYDDSEWPSFTFSNHDRPRAVSRWARNTKEEANPQFAKFLNMLLLTIRGGICLYQGEELGLPQAKIPFEKLRDPEAIANWPDTLGRDGARTPIPWLEAGKNNGFSNTTPWLPIPPEHSSLSIEAQNENANSCLAFTKGLLTLRKRHLALRYGSIRFIETGEPIMAFERSHGDETLLCIFNTGSSSAKHSILLDGYVSLLALNTNISELELPPTSGIILMKTD